MSWRCLGCPEQLLGELALGPRSTPDATPRGTSSLERPCALHLGAQAGPCTATVMRPWEVTSLIDGARVTGLDLE